MLPKSSIAELKSTPAAACMKAENNNIVTQILYCPKSCLRERKITFCWECVFKIQSRIFFSNSNAAQPWNFRTESWKMQYLMALSWMACFPNTLGNENWTLPTFFIFRIYPAYENFGNRAQTCNLHDLFCAIGEIMPNSWDYFKQKNLRNIISRN